MQKRIQFCLFLYILISIIEKINSKRKQIYYKCGVNANYSIPGIAKSINEDINPPLFRRKLGDAGFKDFNIYADFKNLEANLKKNNLNDIYGFFENSIIEAIQTLQSLLRVKPLNCNEILDKNITEDFNIKIWDKEKFGINETNKSFRTCDFEYDLYLFFSLIPLDAYTIAKAQAKLVQESNNQPIIGLIEINKNISLNEELYKSTFLHEITHILGFDTFFFSIKFYLIIFSQIKLKKEHI